MYMEMQVYGLPCVKHEKDWRKRYNKYFGILCYVHNIISVSKGKVKLSLYRLWMPLGLREVEALTFSDIQRTDGGKVVSPTRRQLFTPRKVPGTHFC
jgi:hypothetical protein